MLRLRPVSAVLGVIQGIRGMWRCLDKQFDDEDRSLYAIGCAYYLFTNRVSASMCFL